MQISLLLFWVAQAAASPVRSIFVRQDASSTSASLPTVSPTNIVDGCTVITVSASTMPASTAIDGYVISAASYPTHKQCDCDGPEGNNQTGVYTWDAGDGKETDVCTIPEQMNPNPGENNPDNEDWADVTCDIDSLKSTVRTTPAGEPDPQRAWNDTGAREAYNDCVRAWEVDGSPQPFTAFLRDYFNLPPGVTDCVDIGSATSCGAVNCGQKKDANAPVSSPAGYMIINSISWVYGLYKTASAASDMALGDITPDLKPMVEGLSPIMDEIAAQKQTRLIMDGMQMLIFWGLAPAFHRGRIITKATPNSLTPKKPNPEPGKPPLTNDERKNDWEATVVDVGYGTVGTSFAFGKDAMDQESPDPLVDELESNMNNIKKYLLDGFQNAMLDLASDPKLLFEYMDGGIGWASLTGGVSPDFLENMVTELDLRKAVREGYLTAAVPIIWRISTDFPSPVILTSEGVTHEDPGEGKRYCDGYKIEKDLVVEDLDIATTFVCSPNEKDAYWLVGVEWEEPGAPISTGGPPSVAPNNAGIETDNLFKVTPLRGVEDFDGSTYGNLTLDNVVMNAVNSWTARDKQNDYFAVPEFRNPDVMGALVERKDLSFVHNLVKLPVCGAEEVRSNVKDDPKNEKNNLYWPCSEPENETEWTPVSFPPSPE